MYDNCVSQVTFLSDCLARSVHKFSFCLAEKISISPGPKENREKKRIRRQAGNARQSAGMGLAPLLDKAVLFY
jgi:hypothetical protein